MGASVVSHIGTPSSIILEKKRERIKMISVAQRSLLEVDTQHFLLTQEDDTTRRVLSTDNQAQILDTPSLFQSDRNYTQSYY